jgi:hypothetical protein
MIAICSYPSFLYLQKRKEGNLTLMNIHVYFHLITIVPVVHASYQILGTNRAPAYDSEHLFSPILWCTIHFCACNKCGCLQTTSHLFSILYCVTKSSIIIHHSIPSARVFILAIYVYFFFSEFSMFHGNCGVQLSIIWFPDYAIMN